LEGIFVNVKSNAGKAKVRVTICSLWCQATNFTVAQGLERWTELQTLGQAAAAQAVRDAEGDTSGDSNLTTTMDPFLAGLVVSVGTSTLGALFSWAQSQSGTIVSVQPLWAVAMRCSLATQDRIKGLAIVEPHSLTLLTSMQPNEPADFTLAPSVVTIPVEGELDQAQGKILTNAVLAQLNRWKVANSFQDDAVLTLKFGVNEITKISGMPAAWKGHWSST
jgi:hypothetical protein